MATLVAALLVGASAASTGGDGCDAAIRHLCSTESERQCLVCCGRHQHALREAGCSAADCSASCAAAAGSGSHTAFQPYSAFGNTIHVATADFDGVGASDYVVAATTNGTVMAYQRPEAISDPTADNRLWTHHSGAFAFSLGAAKLTPSGKDNILLPGADGRLRMLGPDGSLLLDLAVGPTNGSCYTADAGFTSKGLSRIVAGGVDGNAYFYDGGSGKPVGQFRPLQQGSIVRRLGERAA